MKRFYPVSSSVIINVCSLLILSTIFLLSACGEKEVDSLPVRTFFTYLGQERVADSTISHRTQWGELIKIISGNEELVLIFADTTAEVYSGNHG
jgi:hypothetical protein